MSCVHNSSQRICDTLKRIVKVQSIGKNNDPMSCSDFNILLGMNPNFDTIPVMLLCKGTCNFFISSGVFHSHEAIECFKTPVYRVTKVIEDRKDQCCVELELLQPQSKNGTIPSCNDDDVCSFFQDKKIQKFIRTGICIIVEIGCFCGIECLPPVNAHRGKPVPCPPKIKVESITEEICGNFSSGTQKVWEAISVDIIEATFQIFNSNHSPAPVEGFVGASTSPSFSVIPGSTISRSIASPESFTIKAPEGTNGKYCIILTKRIL